MATYRFACKNKNCQVPLYYTDQQRGVVVMDLAPVAPAAARSVELRCQNGHEGTYIIPTDVVAQTETAMSADDWRALAKELILGASQHQQDALNRLQTFVLWLWGIFAGGSAVLATFDSKPLDGMERCTFVLAAVLLILAYFGLTIGGLTSVVKFDYDNPSAMRTAWNRRAIRRQWALSLMTALAALGVIAVSWHVWLRLRSVPPAVPTVVTTIHASKTADAVLATGSLGPHNGVPKLVLRNEDEVILDVPVVEERAGTAYDVAVSRTTIEAAKKGVDIGKVSVWLRWTGADGITYEAKSP